MRTAATLFMVVFLFPALALGHGDISKLPSSVQVLQYKMALYMNEDDLDTRNKLAMAYFRTGSLDNAEKELTVILQKDRTNFDALDGMGLVLFKKGQPEAAVKYFDRASDINPNDVMVHVHKSLACEKMGKSGLALEEMARARSLAKGEEGLRRIEDEKKILQEQQGDAGR